MVVAVPQAHAVGFVIIPTFDVSIGNDPNAAAIENAINAAIAIYESTFTNPINVPITFKEGGGLGSSSFSLFDVSYLSFSTSLHADATSADDATAITHNPISSTNPVTGTNDILMKCATIDAVFGSGSSGCASDGTITLNTSLTTPGSPGSSLAYRLQVVAEHEIDEILGLGSTLGLGLSGSCGSPPHPCSNVPSPEDLFRYTAAGARTFTTSSSVQAFFSIDGSTDIARFDNQNDGGDFGDWQSNPLPAGVVPQVQDAFATPGANPALGAEIRALDVIGYTLTSPIPEPGSVALVACGLGLLIMAKRRTHRGRN
jgi:hypothetical protein